MPDQRQRPPGPPSAPEQPHWLLLLLPALLFFLYLLTIGQYQQSSPSARIPYSEFKGLVANGKVESVEFRGTVIDGSLLSPDALGTGAETVDRFTTRMPTIPDQDLLPLLERHSVTVTVKAEESPRSLASVLAGILPWVLMIGIYLWFMRRMSRNLIGGIGRGGDLGKFLKPRSTVEAKESDTKFDDVAGQENAKREVAELAEYLREPGRYARLGAEIPHGVLLMGPPGTGKTLLARALAGEAGVPFFSISASEFIEMFVGVGASRVREIFKQAKQKAPSIIFIDELDSVGRVRGAGLGGGHDEREQTLNQILAEMDGFAGHEAVIVLAATNRPDVLDPALLRPGRFDRHVTLDLPDRKARLAILRVHTRKVPLDDTVDLDEVASGTPGFSGADIKNLVNEAAMLAARSQRQKVVASDFERMRDRVLMGSERSLVMTPEEKHRLAVHESGHTLVAYFLPLADPLFKVTIIPRGRALGATQQLPEAERHTLPEDYLRERLAVMLGGRIAERLELGTLSSGADDDIRQATALARSMVTRWGMDREVGPVDLRDSDEHPFLGREIAQPRKHSEASAEAVDSAVGKLLQEAEAQASDTLTAHRGPLRALIDALEERETLHREEIVAVLGKRPVQTRSLNAVRF